MRPREFGSRTANLTLDRHELRLIAAALEHLIGTEVDTQRFHQLTGTSAAHADTLAGDIASLRHRMAGLAAAERAAGRAPRPGA